MSRNDDMKMKLSYWCKLFSKTTWSDLWNTNFWKTDMYNQFLNRVTENTKIVHGDLYTDKQLRPVLFKATKNQSLPLTPILFKLL